MGSILLFFLAHHLASSHTFFSDEHFHFVILRTAVIVSGVATFGGFCAEPNSPNITEA